MKSNEDYERFARNYYRGEEGDRQNASPALQSEAGGNGAASDTQNMDVNNITQMMNAITALVQQNAQMVAMLQQNQTTSIARSSTPATTDSNIRNYNVMPDLSKTIDDFNGEKGPGTAEAWLHQLQNTATLHSWPSAFTFQTACSHLVGAAKYWLQGRRTEVTDWNLFVPAFKRTFIFEKSKTDTWRRMQERVQQAKENVSRYFYEKVALCKELGLSFSEVKEQVVIGLWSKELSSFVMSKIHEDEDGLYQDIIQFERINSARRGRIVDGREPSRKPLPVMQKTYVPVIPSKQQEVVPTATRVSPGTSRCYNCNRFGHISTQCQRPKRAKGSCYSCGSSEHQRQECPQLTAVPASANSSTATGSGNVTLIVEGNQMSAFIVPICVEKDGYKCVLNGVLDSGSPISLVTVDCAKNLNIKPIDSHITYSGVNGSKLNVLGIVDVNITVSDVTIDLIFHVVNANVIPYSCLLGRNFMMNPNFSVVFKNNIVVIEPIKNKSDLYVDDEIMHICYVENNELDDLNINPNLCPEDKQKVKCLYLDHYVKPVRPIQPAIDFEMKIALKHDVSPFYYKPRRLSVYDMQQVRNIVDELLAQDVIKQSYSEYSSPIVLVRKKNGSTRICCDFRFLNKLVLRENFPIPIIEEQIDKLKDKCYFTKLDLKNAFYHVKVRQADTKYLSFVTPFGQYEFVKMPFGFCNSPSTFMRYIHLIFSDLIRSGEILIYLDDLLIATYDFESHVTILEKVFQLMVTNLLELRLEKCSFFNSEIEYLGYVVDENGVKPSPHNISAVVNFPIPKNKKELHSFLGLVSYFRKFVKDFSVLAKPLYDLQKLNKEFEFGENEFVVFEKLKTILASEPLLCLYSPIAETQLHCDASSLGYGSMLLQKQTDGKFHPVFFFSKRTSEAEAKYHSYELECLCVVYSLKRFHVYLHGIKFKIFTDCDSFRLTLSKKDIVPRIMRWALFLENYEYSIYHRASKQMQHVDALSRCHNILVLEENSFEQNLSIKQQTDVDIRMLQENLEKTQSSMFELRNGLVYRKIKSKGSDSLLFYVPRSMISQVIRLYHDNYAHVGVQKTCELILRTYWFPNMRQTVKDYISNCLKCIVFSSKSGKIEGQLHSIPKGIVPFDTCHIDHYGPLKKCSNGDKYIFLIVDAFTKFLKVYACRTVKTHEVIKHLNSYFAAYSRPKRIVSDRGTAFTSLEFEEFLEEENVKHILIATGCPWANGQVERFNRSIRPMLAKLSESPALWNKVLCDVEFAINNTVNSSTGETPTKLLFGICQNGKIDDEVRPLLESVKQNTTEKLAEIREKASENIVRNQTYNKLKYDKSHKHPTMYCVGDKVVITNTVTTAGVNKKLLPKFKGPYEIEKVLPNDRYILKDVDGYQVTQVPYHGTADSSHMRLWCKDD